MLFQGGCGLCTVLPSVWHDGCLVYSDGCQTRIQKKRQNKNKGQIKYIGLIEIK